MCHVNQWQHQVINLLYMTRVMKTLDYLSWRFHFSLVIHSFTLSLFLSFVIFCSTVLVALALFLVTDFLCLLPFSLPHISRRNNFGFIFIGIVPDDEPFQLYMYVKGPTICITHARHSSLFSHLLFIFFSSLSLCALNISDNKAWKIAVLLRSFSPSPFSLSPFLRTIFLLCIESHIHTY